MSDLLWTIGAEACAQKVLMGGGEKSRWVPLRPTRDGASPVMSAFEGNCTSFIDCPRQHHPIHCRPPTHRSLVARRPLHHVLPLHSLPGRPESCAPGRPPPLAADPRARRSRLRLLPVPVRRGQRRQAREQRLCRCHHHPRPGGQGWNPIPAAARLDRGPAALCIPGTPLGP